MRYTRTLYFVGIGLVFLVVPHLPSAGSCLPPLSRVCENITCPNGKTCTQYISYWCPNRFGGICDAIPICDVASSDPCMWTKCTAATDCVRVKGTCDSYGICSLNSQCNERNRPGSCPSPADVSEQFNSCSNSCQDDAWCESGVKCCPSTPGSTFSEKICARIN